MRLLLFFLLFTIFSAHAQQITVRRADSLAELQEFHKALKAYQSVGTKDALIWTKIAKTYHAQGNITRAIESYRKALELDTTALQPALAIGNLLIKVGKAKEAVIVFKGITRRYPDLAEGYYQLGKALKKLADSAVDQDTLSTARIAAFEMALERNTNYIAARLALGMELLKKKQYDKGISFVKPVLESDPENNAAVLLMAQMYLGKGYCTDAIPLLEVLVDRSYDSSYIHKRLAHCYARLGDYDAAIGQYRILINERGEDKDPTHHLALARLYQRTENFDKGIRHVEIAEVLMNPSLEDVYYSLATLYKLKEDHEQAMQYYLKTLLENPQHKEALYGKAVAADNYYENRDAVLELYQAFVEQYTTGGEEEDPLVRLAQYRIDLLKEEQFREGSSKG